MIAKKKLLSIFRVSISINQITYESLLTASSAPAAPDGVVVWRLFHGSSRRNNKKDSSSSTTKTTVHGAVQCARDYHNRSNNHHNILY